MAQRRVGAGCGAGNWANGAVGCDGDAFGGRLGAKQGLCAMKAMIPRT